MDEMIIYLCSEHYGLDLSHYPYVFNSLPNFLARECHVENCFNAARYRFVGCSIPEYANPPTNRSRKPINEIYMEGLQAMTNGPAIEKLTDFIYFRTRTYTIGLGDISARMVIKELAKLLLQELEIPQNWYLSEAHIDKILKRLKIYPE